MDGQEHNGGGETVIPSKLMKHLRWRLDAMMRDRQIKTAVELHKRLQELGVDLSLAQVSRVVAERPVRLNTELLDALVQILDCTPNDLLVKEDLPL